MEIRPILSTLARHKMAAALIVLEIALSCAIICNALFIVTQRLETLNLASGMDDDRLVEVALSGIGQQTDADARTAEDLASLRAVAGVERVAISNQLPFQNGSWNTSLSLSAEQEVPTLNATQYMFGEGTLATMGLKLLAGRDFNADEYKSNDELSKIEDVSTLSSAIILSKAAADKMFPEGDAIGKTVYMANIPLTIVGVVDTLLRPNMMGGNRTFSVIFPIRMNFSNGGRYLIRVSDPARRAEVLEQALAALDRNDPNRLVWRKQTYEEGRAKYFANDRDMIGLLLIVSALLLLVTALGIVGLASFWVQQRTKQIGIRRALGATKGQILRYFQTENFLLATIGIIVGMLLAYLLNQWLMGRYELPRLPLLYLPVGAAALWLLGQLAVFGPARRAAAIPPAVATRST
ncbi:MAG: ABC transporter permease [Lysobacteraceae bacterium SCN 69-123]|jgi:putative ABC transport system permease protein|uniref:ABC transporter permease n=1 Tax=Stenotrophomonas acidaminiphila TaxID=128780 RepID=UPI00086C43E3|nr:FtsX-like permease family protein [Stenotrophomonas acidaminiphila]MBN8800259.1 ABC transporter permease [Stenotrophomonas acidaminiphila]MDF9442718.1 FtsX-like permease family protein [Stenotrophomonas acidaminiphila]ODU41760.1 MAG: ABC transporter permease [Xanthomonadaceae bacterium SCN 69-123]OJY77850.1 MAG: ABC transporter permease [Stenotrophomonas sp. 69-14]